MQCGIAKNFYFWIQFFSKLSRTLCDDDLGCGQCNRESDVKAIGFWIEGDFLLCHISRIIMMIMMTLRSMKTFLVKILSFNATYSVVLQMTCGWVLVPWNDECYGLENQRLVRARSPLMTLKTDPKVGWSFKSRRKSAQTRLTFSNKTISSFAEFFYVLHRFSMFCLMIFCDKAEASNVSYRGTSQFPLVRSNGWNMNGHLDRERYSDAK